MPFSSLGQEHLQGEAVPSVTLHYLNQPDGCTNDSLFPPLSQRPELSGDLRGSQWVTTSSLIFHLLPAVTECLHMSWLQTPWPFLTVDWESLLRDFVFSFEDTIPSYL